MADLVIVSIVWEGEPGALPNERQRAVAEALADAGASIVVGYADHAVQPVCWIDDHIAKIPGRRVIADHPGESDQLLLIPGTYSKAGRVAHCFFDRLR